MHPCSNSAYISALSGLSCFVPIRQNHDVWSVSFARASPALEIMPWRLFSDVMTISLRCKERLTVRLRALRCCQAHYLRLPFLNVFIRLTRGSHCTALNRWTRPYFRAFSHLFSLVCSFYEKLAGIKCGGNGGYRWHSSRSLVKASKADLLACLHPLHAFDCIYGLEVFTISL